MLRPNAYLSFTLDETFATPDNFSLLKRAYSYVAPCSMETGKENELLITIKMGSHEFMDSFDAAQQASWDTEVSDWLRTKIRKVKETMEECDNPKRRSYMGVIPFTWLVLKIQNRELRFFLVNNEFPPVFDIVAALRRSLALTKTPYNDVVHAVFPNMNDIDSYRQELAKATTNTTASERAEDACEGCAKGRLDEMRHPLPQIDYTQGQVMLSSGEVRTIPTA